jgi:hypothetical protein
LIPDVASCRDAELEVGPPADANDVVALLERCARKRGGWTVEELDADLERGDPLVSRARFYGRVRRAVANATANCDDGRA